MTTSKGVELLKFTLTGLQSRPSSSILLEPSHVTSFRRKISSTCTFYKSLNRPAFTSVRISQQPSTLRISSALYCHSFRFAHANFSSAKSFRTNLREPSRLERRSYRGESGCYHRTVLGANHKQGGISSWTAIIIGGFITGTIIYTTSSKLQADQETLTKCSRQPRRFSISEDSSTSPQADITESWDSMTAATPPGRVGTLTAEQEGKLRELWIATLNVFGVLDSSNENGAGAVNGTNKTEGATTKKPKKKRLGVFSRKKGGDDTDSTTSAASSVLNSPIKADVDDKYGQTKEFHEALANLTPETIRATFWSMVKMDHPDALLLRFLRARKWDVEKALVMLVSTMRWRSNDAHVDDDIMKNGEAFAIEQAAGSDPSKKKVWRGFSCSTKVREELLARPGQGGKTDVLSRLVLTPPADTACVVFDMTGFSMANMDYAPVKFMIKCFEANYPESLGVVLVHKAPWIFQGIWKIIKAWLDPVVASKVHFTNSQEDMEQFVPKNNIIKELGGDEDWEYKYLEPVPGENSKMEDIAARDKLFAEQEAIVKEYEKATLSWLNGEDEDLNAIKTKRNHLAKDLRDNYWATDPYLRARCHYDRAGMIKVGGEIDFYPKPENSTTKTPETSADDVD
ncbi:hypothetical protein B7463_g12127, partial [Scytalidium lignicola]